MIGETKYNCKIELSKKNGISICIRDLSQPEQVYRQILLEGDALTICTHDADTSATITQTSKSLTSEVKDSEGSTTVEQGPSVISVKCKTLSIEAEGITVKSTKDTAFTASGKWTLSADGDLNVETKANCEIKSTSAMTLDATGTATLKSAADLKLQAPKLAATADASVDITSSGSVNVKGGAVSVKGDMRAELDSPSTTVGSTMTTVRGDIVSVTGSMVKLG